MSESAGRRISQCVEATENSYVAEVHRTGVTMIQRNSARATTDTLMAVLSTIRAQAMSRDERTAVAADAVRFITISRQAGAGAKQLAARLAERLNARLSDGPRWTSWDR